MRVYCIVGRFSGYNNPLADLFICQTFSSQRINSPNFLPTKLSAIQYKVYTESCCINDCFIRGYGSNIFSNMETAH